MLFDKISSNAFLMCDVITRNKCSVTEEQVIVGSEEESSISWITCGSCDSLCWKSCIVDDGNSALRRYEEQLVALHCPEALTRDMDQFTYPICNTIQSSSSSIIGQGKMNCLGRFSINMLHMLNVLFAADFDIWLTQEGKQKFKFEDMLMTVENFLSKQQELVKLKVM